MNIFIVIPTIRTLSFLDDWGDQFNECHLIIVEDHKKKEIETPSGKYRSLHHYAWDDIKNDFGKDEWIFPRKNAGVRSYGFWKAYVLGADIIITIDDDCFPVGKGFVGRHVKNLSLWAPDKWTTTFPHPDFLFTRGFPYKIRDKYPVVISHGLWSNQMDLDAKTQLKHEHIHMEAYPSMLGFVPRGYFYPMSSMNLAFNREITPLMYFPLMGQDPEEKNWGYDRYDDIWAGIFAKKICDHLGLSVANGSPFVEHRKASDPQKNLIKEKRGITTNEILWNLVDEVVLTKRTPIECYKQLARTVRFPNERYFRKLREAMLVWANLF